MPELSPLPPTLIREELARLIDSDALRRAPSHMRLLRYLVEKRVSGDAAALRETAIALEVFRRDPSTYDPQTDPIVRVTTGRLRDRLEAHYARYEAPPKLRIVLPKGRYAPEFVAVDGAASPPLGVAVLRTRNQTGDSALDGCCDAFADRLADQLSRAGLPRVMTRGAVDSAEALSRDPTVLGTQLHVPWLVESTLAREHENDLRLSVRLVHAADATARWVETGVSAAPDVYKLSDQMVDLALVRALETLPTPAALRDSTHLRTPLPTLQRASLDRARLLVLQRTVDATDQAIALTDAVAADHPEAADAWAALASALYSRLSFMDRDNGPIVARVRACADRALVLDPQQPTALRTKAIVLGKCDFDAAGAELLFQRALRTMPHYTSARLNYAEILTLSGRFAEAMATLNLARNYDPLSATVHLAHAICLGYARRYDDARNAWTLCRATGEMSLWVLTGAGMNELAAGNFDAAETLVAEAVARFPDMPTALLCRAYVHAARGDAEAALALDRACIARFPHYSPANRAVLAALLRDRRATLQLLTAALDARDMDFLYATIQPAFDWLADDPELRGLRARCPVWAHRVSIAAQ